MAPERWSGEARKRFDVMAAALQRVILDAAARKELGRLTVVEIAARAGVSASTLYHCYPNREALLASVLEKHWQPIIREINQSSGVWKHVRVEKRLTAWFFVFLVESLRRRRDIQSVHAIRQLLTGEAATAGLAGLRGSLRRTLDPSQTAPSPVLNAELDAVLDRLLWKTCQAALAPGPQDLQGVAAGMMHFALGSLATHGFALFLSAASQRRPSRIKKSLDRDE
jgi:AcrR family transcriptional regulator